MREMRLPGKKFWAKAIRRRVSTEEEEEEDVEPDILPWEVPFDQVNKQSSGQLIEEESRAESASDASLHTSPDATRIASTPSRALSPHSHEGCKRLVRRRLVHGPVFGVKLDAVVASTHLIELYEEADDLPDELYHWRYCPSIVVRCLQFLNREDRLEEEGIYRVPGSNQTVLDLKNDFDEHGDVHIAARRRVQTADVASLLKLYLRELPTPIVSDTQAGDLLARYDLDEKQLSLALNSAGARPRPHRNLRVGLSMLKLEQFFLLRALSKHLHAVQAQSNANFMDIHNLSIVFTSTSNLNLAAPLIAALIAKPDIWTELTCCHLPGPVNLTKSLRSSTSSPAPAVPVTAQSSSDSSQHHYQRPRKASLVSEVLSKVRHSDASNQVAVAHRATTAEQGEDLWGGVANDDPPVGSRAALQSRPSSKAVSAIDGHGMSALDVIRGAAAPTLAPAAAAAPEVSDQIATPTGDAEAHAGDVAAHTSGGTSGETAEEVSSTGLQIVPETGKTEPATATVTSAGSDTVAEVRPASTPAQGAVVATQALLRS